MKAHVRSLVIGIALIAGSLGAAFALSSTGDRSIARLLAVPAAGGVVLTVRGVIGLARGSRRAKIAIVSASVLAVVAGAFAYNYERASRRMIVTASLCRRAQGETLEKDSLDARRTSLAEADRRLEEQRKDVLYRLATTVNDLDRYITEACERSRTDLRRVDEGLCTHRLMQGVACKCGETSWPVESGSCKAPICVYGWPAKKEGLYCPVSSGLEPWQPDVRN